MSATPTLLILGASARAAAYSALRAGLQPWCADLFADADLVAVCDARAVPPERYPGALVEAAADGPPGPWMYTGALENHPGLVYRISGRQGRRRWLWGNDEEVLHEARSPTRVARVVRDAGFRSPQVVTKPEQMHGRVRWLVKPLAGAGGSGIAFADDRPASCGRGGVYYQEFVEGESCAAVYAKVYRQTALLGVTRQFVGEPWLHAPRFHYCGSVGPLALDRSEQSNFRMLGDFLARGLGLRGLFGVDCVLRDGLPWPVEVNPRYTASVEVIEHATGLKALAWHRAAFDHLAAKPVQGGPATSVIGKGIYWAPCDLVIPEAPPWADQLREPLPPETLPPFADLPLPGQAIKRGRPVVTALVRGVSVADAVEKLREVAAALDRALIAR